MSAPSAPPPPADGPREPELWWSRNQNAVYRVYVDAGSVRLAERFDSENEFDRLPKDAVRLVPAPAVAVPAETRNDERHEIEVDDLCARVMDLSAMLRGMARAAVERRQHRLAWASRAFVAEGELSKLRGQLAKAEQGVTAVRALHQRDESKAAMGIEVCAGCATHVTYTEWPCKTIQALDGSAGSAAKLSVQPKARQTPAGSPETGDTATAGQVRAANEAWRSCRDDINNALDQLAAAGCPPIESDGISITLRRFLAARGSDATTPDPAAPRVHPADIVDERDPALMVKRLDYAIRLLGNPHDVPSIGDRVLASSSIALVRAALAGTAPTPTEDQKFGEPLKVMASRIRAAMDVCLPEMPEMAALETLGVAFENSVPTSFNETIAAALAGVPATTHPALIGTWADPDFRAHQEHKHPIAGCGFCPQEEDR